ncbi:hypothetical protein FisN_30Lh017 [Fistulifera solaris]|uniref:Endonuclease/exonuclease/phosphatase domain-containing protein n=1 Tax=Fistulifera solaris TaxID=1519565 RepID=A0A1Z5JIR6_FISSO|nr:hypothetical protein FisN_30Lh017 [Fistulifera solaris]|eukprot:GAX13732.1 hypothetical protein FisN_30Lh017 [Fistulifera solaris]
MTIVQHLVGPALLPTSLELPSLSVLTYNVLLPNSVDGWWNYKMYHPPSDNNTFCNWEYRQQLLKERIAAVDADVVCLQEVSPLSFDDDFAFMTEELGYTGKEIFKRGRFRPATFWKRCELVAPAIHKDRTLLTAFRRDDEQIMWYVLNCHLQAGAEARRRVRQIHEGTKAVITLAKKLQEVEAEKNAKVIVCGDFNGGQECAAIRFLEDGFVDESFIEDGAPVVSSRKGLPFQPPLRDVFYEMENAPPTLVVSELISLLVEHGSAYEQPQFTEDVLQRLERIFDRYATHHRVEADERVMNVQDVERWLIAINGQVGRGSEFREAARQMGWTESAEGKDEASEGPTRITLPVNGYLTLEGFRHVYENELKGGKFWGIAYDLAVLGEPLPDAGVFQSRYDRIYGSSAIQPTAVMHFRSEVACPNEHEPSDHLPVAAAFVVANR